MRRLSVIFLIFFGIGLNRLCAQMPVNFGECIFQANDKQIVEDKLRAFSPENKLPINDLIVNIGLSFIGTPYVAATLENGPEEKLVVDLRELDCTTFVENVLALARTVKSKKTDFESFVAELQQIRYRDGIRNQYPSRLHYFSEWISNNQQKGIVSGLPNQNGVKLDAIINFMSTHPNDYPVLKTYPEMISVIALQEKKLTGKGFWYFPKAEVPNLYKSLKHGDIVALTSTIYGVDVNHVGIVVKKDDNFYLLHASQSGKKVLLSEGPITDFIKPQSKNSGIMIARPVF